ncbi:GAF domain-containing protein [Saccharothrix sp. NRRL B-16348]|uniref:GAF domain-containing protein n=1 Tax=Saccharothrix sp. NRRL B-16348 TaxID=1415542 RepID=UPI0006AE2D92|nr:GAF domain-containing protein [Saccharothrix sp. NRRL B-16348]
MPGVQDQIAVALSEITTGLADGRDTDSVLGMVTAACTRLLAASATGVLLADPRGGIRVVSASDERARFVELMQAQSDEGPCVECIRDGTAVSSADLTDESNRWPLFAPAAVRAGYRSVQAVPMRLDGRVVGGLNVLYTRPGAWVAWQDRLGRVLADLAVLGLSQEGDVRRVDRLAERTLTALNDRVQLAHAIGMVAGARAIDTEHARTAILAHARLHDRPVRDIARAVTDGSLDPATLALPAPDHQADH